MTSKNLAFLFPGQGSQKVGMLAEYAQTYPEFVAVFSKASEVLEYDLWDLIQTGPEEKLNLTEITQPALLTSSIALWEVWSAKQGVVPAFVAGHSLGEWSALVCAGVVTLENAVKLVQLRGRYMQEAVPVGEGAMAAIIGLDDDKILAICAENKTHGEVAAVNFNAPGQVVIAGVKAAVDAASEACKAAGAKRAVELPVSAPFHTTLMKPAADRLANDLKDVEFHDPSIPIYHNVTAAPEASGAKIKDLMIEQIYSPVRWVECVASLADQGVTQALECGPGKVLAGLARRIDKRVSVANAETIAAMDAAL